MDIEKALGLAERVLNLTEVIGCGIVDKISGERIVYVGDFLESDWCTADLWGSMASVVSRKLGQNFHMSMVRNDLYKLVVIPLETSYLAAKISSEAHAWQVAAKMEPIAQTIG